MNTTHPTILTLERRLSAVLREHGMFEAARQAPQQMTRAQLEDALRGWRTFDLFGECPRVHPR